jgi:membrane protein implicated in regulation of membrane protease activity
VVSCWKGTVVQCRFETPRVIVESKKNLHFFIFHSEEVIMHHLLLLVVLLGWILFLILSWQIALPLYVMGVIVSLAIYRKIIQVQRKMPIMGKGAMIGDRAIVVRVEGSDIEVQYEGEIWRAISSQPLQSGQKVMIEGVEGLTLRVKPTP